MSKKLSRVAGVRNPDLVARFGRRLDQAIRELGVTQTDLGRRIGFRNTTISRLVRGQLQTVPVDLILALARWAESFGISVAWLLVDSGAMRRTPTTEGLNADRLFMDAMAWAVLVNLARHAGIDIDAMLRTWQYEIGLPAGGRMGVNLRKVIEAGRPDASTAGGGEAAAADPPGYVLVGQEDVPTRADWWHTHVPVLGRVAAGSGGDTVEAGQYPPAWADEYVLHKGAPQTAIAVRVTGGSMRPQYEDGDIVIVDPARPAEPGAICCVLIDRDGQAEPRLKRLRLEGQTAVLESLAEGYPPERVPRRRVLRAMTLIDHLPRGGTATVRERRGTPAR